MTQSFRRLDLLLFTVLVLVPLGVRAQSSKEDAAKDAARGKYLIESVGVCSDCHTPRDGRGQLDEKRSLQGAPLGFQPIQPIPGWAAAASSIAGLPGWSEASAIKFLMTGIDRSGKPARPPMPPYRFSRADATAAVAYLKSLKPVKP